MDQLKDKVAAEAAAARQGHGPVSGVAEGQGHGPAGAVADGQAMD